VAKSNTQQITGQLVDSNGWRLGIRGHSNTWSTGENVDWSRYSRITRGWPSGNSLWLLIEWKRSDESLEPDM